MTQPGRSSVGAAQGPASIPESRSPQLPCVWQVESSSVTVLRENAPSLFGQLCCCGSRPRVLGCHWGQSLIIPFLLSEEFIIQKLVARLQEVDRDLGRQVRDGDLCTRL